MWRPTAADEGSGRRETYILYYIIMRAYNTLLRDLCSFSCGMYYVYNIYILYDLRIWWYWCNNTMSGRWTLEIIELNRSSHTMYYIILGLGNSFNCSEHSLYREVLRFSSMLNTQYFEIIIKKKYFFNYIFYYFHNNYYFERK